MAVERVFIPWGEFKPDGRLFGGGAGSGDLLECFNVLPIAGSYRPAPTWQLLGSGIPGALAVNRSHGLHVHPTGSNTWAAYEGDGAAIYQISIPSGALTNMSRTGGAPKPYHSEVGYGWQACSYGDSVIFVNRDDIPQILLKGAANFVDMPTSTFKPQWRFVVPYKQNVVGAWGRIVSPYDTLLAQDYPQLVGWSQDLNARAWGSANLEPELLGSDFTQLLNDYGEITGMVAGEYVIIAQQRGMIRMEGPAGSAFSLRPVVSGTGCAFPLSMVYVEGDVYFWGPNGPAVLRGGEGPPVALGLGSVAVSLTDNSGLGWGGDAIASGLIGNDVCHVAATFDPLSRIVRWIYTSMARQTVASSSEVGDRWVAYNIDEGRFSFGRTQVARSGAPVGGVIYPRTRIDTSDPWMPFGMDVAMFQVINETTGAITEYPAVQEFFNASDLVARLGHAFVQIDPKRTTRIQRCRPVFSRGISASNPTGLSFSLELTSCIRTYELSGPVTYTARDSHGWITTPQAVFGDFHRTTVVFDGSGTEGLYSLIEPEGVEIEYVRGPAYGA